MKFLNLILALTLSIFWILYLNAPIGQVPALGKFFDPVSGFWANAENVNMDLHTIDLPEHSTRKKVDISLDERMVPHITAQNDEDLYFAQGFVHAYFRLWQMDMQTRAASGRLSEVIGEKTLDYDRLQRRKGMVWAAENSLALMEKDSVTKKVLGAYTKGVNAYIHSLKYEQLPLEYKLMNFKPEDWSNLKIAFMIKFMADDLTGKVDDLPLSYLRSAFSENELDYLFPEKIENSNPVIPNGTPFSPASSRNASVPSGKLFSDFTIKENQKTALNKLALNHNPGIGSNNWAVQLKDSLFKSTILCNDPHLTLNLPSIWFENQITDADLNFYGVSLPGAPGVVIGFNDSISFGVTNNYRDVKDYFELKSDDPRFYIFDGKEVPFNYRIEEIKVKGRAKSFNDTMRYSIHGPVIYDEHYPEPSESGKMLAMSWMAHKGTNELKALYLMNRANNYNEFVKGMLYFECPAQNFIYSDRSGNIALWGQGLFVNKWKNQGKFVMRGDISATLWGKYIPMEENPHVFNPATQNYLASANQSVTDNTYPYWYNGDFSEFRSWEINHFLKDSSFVNTDKMMALQNNTWSYLAEKIAPYYFYYGTAEREKHVAYFTDWNFEYAAESKTATAFQIWWHFLYQNIWKDEFSKFPESFYPSPERTMQIIIADSSSKYFDDVHTPDKETLSALAQRSFKQTWDSISILEKKGGAEWYKVKNTSITHLAKMDGFSFTGLKTGGWGNTINAMKQNHGPSWRMIVEMKPDQINAYGTYPGGQSGNPGSKHYADFLNKWVEGTYYKLNFIPKATQKK